MANVEIVEYENHGFQMKRKRWVDCEDWELDFKEGCFVKHVDEPQEKYKFVEYREDIEPKGIVIVNKHNKTRTVYSDMVVRKSKPEDPNKPKRKRKTKTTQSATTKKKRGRKKKK